MTMLSRLISRRGVRALLLSVLLITIPTLTLPTDAAGLWRWPVEGSREVTEPFRAPAHAYGPGHRGIDVAAAVDQAVHAPASGVVAFRGTVVDRPLITIDHGGGLVSTFEPVESELAPGTAVRTGDVLGAVAVGGHSPEGQLHIGVRVDGVYTNPMLMFEDVPRAVLLPCCEALTRGDAPDDRWL